MLMRSVPPRCRKKSPHSLSSSHRGSPLLRQRERAGGPPGTRGPSAGGGGVLPGPLRPILGGRKGHEAVLGTQVLSAEPVLKTTQAGRRTESLEEVWPDIPVEWGEVSENHQGGQMVLPRFMDSFGACLCLPAGSRTSSTKEQRHLPALWSQTLPLKPSTCS